MFSFGKKKKSSNSSLNSDQSHNSANETSNASLHSDTSTVDSSTSSLNEVDSDSVPLGRLHFTDIEIIKKGKVVEDSFIIKEDISKLLMKGDLVCSFNLHKKNFATNPKEVDAGWHEATEDSLPNMHVYTPEVKMYVDILRAEYEPGKTPPRTSSSDCTVVNKGEKRKNSILISEGDPLVHSIPKQYPKEPKPQNTKSLEDIEEDEKNDTSPSNTEEVFSVDIREDEGSGDISPLSCDSTSPSSSSTGILKSVLKSSDHSLETNTPMPDSLSTHSSSKGGSLMNPIKFKSICKGKTQINVISLQNKKGNTQQYTVPLFYHKRPTNSNILFSIKFLPFSHTYSPLEKILFDEDDNVILESLLMQPLDNSNFSLCLAQLFVNNDRVNSICSLVFDIEFKKTKELALLLRDTSTAVDVLSKCIRMTGQEFLEQALQPIDTYVSFFEVPEVKEDDLKKKKVSSIQKQLVEMAKKIIDNILDSYEHFPPKLMVICRDLSNRTKAKFGNSADNSELTVALSVLLFLRFICPAILTPHAVLPKMRGLKPKETKFLVHTAKLLHLLAQKRNLSDMSSDPMSTLMAKHIEKRSKQLDNFYNHILTSKSTQSQGHGATVKLETYKTIETYLQKNFENIIGSIKATHGSETASNSASKLRKTLDSLEDGKISVSFA